MIWSHFPHHVIKLLPRWPSFIHAWSQAVLDVIHFIQAGELTREPINPRERGLIGKLLGSTMNISNYLHSKLDLTLNVWICLTNPKRVIICHHTSHHLVAWHEQSRYNSFSCQPLWGQSVLKMYGKAFTGERLHQSKRLIKEQDVLYLLNCFNWQTLAEAICPLHEHTTSRAIMNYQCLLDKPIACNKQKVMGDRTFRMLMEKDSIDSQMTLHSLPTNQDWSVPFALYVFRHTKWQSLAFMQIWFLQRLPFYSAPLRSAFY